MRYLLTPFVVLAFLFAGCSSSDRVVMRPVPIAGGKIVPIPFGSKGPIPGKANGYEVLIAATNPGPVATQLIYKFAFSAPAGAQLKQVVVDDISDEQSARVLVDEKPWLDASIWRSETKPYDSKDPLLAWIYTVTHSLRVYRFTITDSQGRQTTLYHLAGYPPHLKAGIRASWGEKY